MKYTLHWLETVVCEYHNAWKKKVSGARGGKSKWRAEMLTSQEKRCILQFSSERAAERKNIASLVCGGEVSVAWFPKKCPNQAARDINLIKGPDPTEVVSYLFSDMFARDTWHKLAPWHETVEAKQTNKTLCVLKFSWLWFSCCTWRTALLFKQSKPPPFLPSIPTNGGLFNETSEPCRGIS